ncbi:MAG: hypothetical protein AAGB31_11815 [Bdellovibrio sp.]
MSNFRVGLRQSLAAHLLNKTQAGEHVYVSRRSPLVELQTYPVVLIYGGPEIPTRVTMGSGVYQRIYSVTIESRVARVMDLGELDSIDDEFDLIADEIEHEMKAFVLPGLLDVIYVGAEPELSDESDTPFGSLKMRFDFKYVS